jgi:hypothetical protein
MTLLSQKGMKEGLEDYKAFEFQDLENFMGAIESHSWHEGIKSLL